MNKKLIALAVAAASFSGVAAAAEVYSSDTASLAVGGRAEMRTRLNDGDIADRTRARINVAGTSQINDDLTAVGFTEFEYTSSRTSVAINADDEVTISNAFAVRHIYAGVAGDFGQVTYGRQDGAMAGIADYTDIMNTNGGFNYSAITEQTTSTLLYSNNFNGLNVRASVKLEEGEQDNAGFSASATYDVAGVNIGGGYTEQGDAKQFIVGAGYSIDALYLGATFTDSNDASQAMFGTPDQGIEVATRYTMGKTHFGAGFFTQNDIDGFVTLETGYRFSSNLRSALGTDINLDDSKKTNVNFQLRYDF